MSRIRPRTLALLAVLPLLVGAAPVQAGTVAIDFEWLPGPDGRLGTADDLPMPDCPGGFCFPLADEFASEGLHFTSGTLFQGDLFPGTPATNHYVGSSPLDVQLAGDGRGVSVDSYSSWTAVLWLLDAQDQVVGTATLVNPAPGNPFFGTLTLVSSTPFRRATVRPEGCAPADTCGQILNVDELTIAFVEIFADGFESGDTSLWSTAVP